MTYLTVTKKLMVEHIFYISFSPISNHDHHQFFCFLEAILSAFLTAYCDILPHLPDIHPRGKGPKSLLPVLTWWLHI